MENLSRRRALTLGVALGLVGAAAPVPAWASAGTAGAGKLAGAGAAAGPGPEWIWDDAADPLMVRMIEGGHVPAINRAWRAG